MIELTGDLMSVHAQGGLVVIPTNPIINARGELVMGRGLALAFKRKLPALPTIAAIQVQQAGPTTVIVDWTFRVILFPVKHHWREPASLALITSSAGQLGPKPLGPVFLPRVGCGNGRLDWATVRPILDAHLVGPNFIVVTPPHEDDFD